MSTLLDIQPEDVAPFEYTHFDCWFDGSSSAYPLEARLKYREKDGKVTFWYGLIRSDRVFKTAVTDELARIKEATGFASVMSFYGGKNENHSMA